MMRAEPVDPSGCSIIECVLGRGETLRADLDRGKCEAEAADNKEKDETSHAVCVCKARTVVGKRFPRAMRIIFQVTIRSSNATPNLEKNEQ